MARTKMLCMPHVPGLRSPYAKVGRLVYFGRMLDKIRFHAMGKLPPEYETNLGDAQPKFGDGRGTYLRFGWLTRFATTPFTNLSSRDSRENHRL